MGSANGFAANVLFLLQVVAANDRNLGVRRNRVAANDHTPSQTGVGVTNLRNKVTKLEQSERLEKFSSGRI